MPKSYNFIKDTLWGGLKYYDRCFGLSRYDSFILVYHRIIAGNGKKSNEFRPNGLFELDKKSFEDQIVYLKKNYEIIPLDSLIRQLKNSERIEGKIAITFDDGYRDNYEYAFPVLKQHNVPATIYLLESILSDNIILLWWLAVEDMMLNARQRTLEFNFNGARHFYSIVDYDSKLKAIYQLNSLFLCLKPTDQTVLLNSIKDAVEIDSLPDYRGLLLTKELISEMNKSRLISFGCHTLSHCNLTLLLSDLELEREIVESREILELGLEVPVVSFSYPFGSPRFINDRVVNFVKKAGFEYAVTGISDGLRSSISDVFLLPRIAMAGVVTVDDLAVRISRPYNLIKRMRHI